MGQQTKVKDIMTKLVLSVPADMPLLDAAKMLHQEGFTGLPVADDQNKLVGLITIGHLSKFYSPSLTTDLPLHLPTLIALLKKMHVYRKDAGLAAEVIDPLCELKVADIMSLNPITLTPESPVAQAIAMLKQKRLDPMPVVDAGSRLLGIVTRFDLLKILDKDYTAGSASGLQPHSDSMPYFSDRVKLFMNLFEKEFIFVSKIRAYYWLLFSFGFAIVGFLLAYIMILRINL